MESGRATLHRSGLRFGPRPAQHRAAGPAGPRRWLV